MEGVHIAYLRNQQDFESCKKEQIHGRMSQFKGTLIAHAEIEANLYEVFIKKAVISEDPTIRNELYWSAQKHKQEMKRWKEVVHRFDLLEKEVLAALAR